MNEPLISLLKKLLHDVTLFARYASGLQLRAYQAAVARAVADSVIHGRGLTFVVVFPRQSGKNELQAQIEAYLLTLLSQTPAELVKVSPTWKPQSLNAMRRLERALSKNLLAGRLWRKEQGYIYRVGAARIFFLSGSPRASVVGATASTLLECDEAQDVLAAKWDKDFAPMAASTNATRVFWGTAWTSQTLLGRELRAALQAEQADGIRRVWRLDAAAVAAEAPAYGRFVAGEIARLGRNHPLVKSQFFSEEIDAEGGMFPPARLALMQGSHLPAPRPPGETMIAFLLDVAGAGGPSAGEGGPPPDPARDATALTVVAAGLEQFEALRGPVYRVLARYAWQGLAHPQLYGQVLALAEAWQPAHLVIDATGVGAGLASFLERALPGRVIPFTFNRATKSKLGWGFLAVVETGRYREHAPDRAHAPDGAHAPDRAPDRAAQAGLQAQFWQQCRLCQMEVLPGPERRLAWGVPAGTRDPASGAPVHDDLLVSAALCAVLDGLAWRAPKPLLVIPGRDPLLDMERF